MLLKDIPGVLTKDQLAKALMLIGHIKYVDGRATGASIGRAVKQNQQMHMGGEEAVALVDLVRDALLDREEFTGAVFPMKMHLNINRYADGMHYGRHNDAAVVGPSMADAVRTDISFTVFLAEPDDYDGGEMVIQTDHGEEEVKLAAGELLPGRSGARRAAGSGGVHRRGVSDENAPQYQPLCGRHALWPAQ